MAIRNILKFTLGAVAAAAIAVPAMVAVVGTANSETLRVPTLSGQSDTGRKAYIRAPGNAL